MKLIVNIILDLLDVDLTSDDGSIDDGPANATDDPLIYAKRAMRDLKMIRMLRAPGGAQRVQQWFKKRDRLPTDTNKFFGIGNKNDEDVTHA